MRAILGTVMLFVSTAGAFGADDPHVLDRSCGKDVCTAMLAVDRKATGSETTATVEFVTAPGDVLDSLLGAREGERHRFTASCWAGTIKDEEDLSPNGLVQIRKAPTGYDTKAVPPTKAALNPRILRIVMDYACAPGAEIDNADAGAEYFGTWVPSLDQCDNDESDAKTIIDKAGLKEYESFCEIRRVVPSGQFQWWLVMLCQGEGDTWKEHARVTLLDKGKAMFERSVNKSFSRSVGLLCPAKSEDE